MEVKQIAKMSILPSSLSPVSSLTKTRKEIREFESFLRSLKKTLHSSILGFYGWQKGKIDLNESIFYRHTPNDFWLLYTLGSLISWNEF